MLWPFVQIASPGSRASLGVRLSLVFLSSFVFLTACSDFMSPVKETPEPTEYSYNYWLLQRTYLFEDELPKLENAGDSVKDLYKALDDPYTRYVPPSNSEQAVQQLNTSIIEGDIGLEYMFAPEEEHVLFIYQVYPKSPAAKAGVPRYGNIISINGHEIKTMEDMNVYDSVLVHSEKVSLKIRLDSTTKTYKMKKENVYAPTVFVDTIGGITYIQIREFKPETVDQDSGSLGELRDYLDSTRNEKGVRVLDLRNNPGGHVNQCVDMADLFVEKGTLSSRHWRAFDPNGKPVHRRDSHEAKKGDAGEKGKFLILVNENSASCAEIFTAAVTELAPIPVVGHTTFGKGIGQTTWHTKAGGLAIITNLEFITPKKNSYNKTGIKPDYPCNDYESIYECVEDAAKAEFGHKKSNKSKFSGIILPRVSTTGGAYIESEDNPEEHVQDEF